MALNRPQREDERLTSPTIPQALRKLQVGILPDPDRTARLERKAANVKAAESANRRKRIEALQTLYMNARHFIVTEEQLNARIDRVFNEPALSSRDRGLWHVGPPMSIQNMLDEISRAKDQPTLQDLGRGVGRGVVDKRLDQIGAELTGGT
jgi:enoyl-CoA hydratase/carnithine racemase